MTADRGTALTSNESNEFLKENHVKLILVAIGSPQANGQIERVNRILAPMLGKLSNDKTGKLWYKLLKSTDYSVNNTVKRTAGDTLNRLLFGANQRGDTVDDVKELLENHVKTSPRDLKKLRLVAADKTEKSQIYHKEYHDKKRKDPHS